jgi:hypothetical protein
MDKINEFIQKGRSILKYGAIAIILIKTLEYFFAECEKEFGKQQPNETNT